jgi:hypothetical protein
MPLILEDVPAFTYVFAIEMQEHAPASLRIRFNGLRQTYTEFIKL